MVAIDDLKAKLATPVDLPVVLMDYHSADYIAGFIHGVARSADAISAAGFTVEGDEQ